MQQNTPDPKPIALALGEHDTGLLAPGKNWTFLPRMDISPRRTARFNPRSSRQRLQRSPAAFGPATTLHWAVRAVDARLRRQQNIFEFCDDPRCVLRIALRPADENLGAPNGLRLNRGEIIGELHLWNEHIPRITDAGPDLFWAVLIRRRVSESLAMLAGHVLRDPRFHQVRIFRAATRLAGGKPRAQMEQIARYYGFDLTGLPLPETWRAKLVDLGECLHLWGLIQTFNPRALARRGWIQTGRHQLWISRETLLSRYAAPAVAGARECC